MNSPYINILPLFVTICLVSFSAIAQPVLAKSIVVDGQTLFRDMKKANLFYSMPPSFQLSVDDRGRPNLSLLQMRYTGTTASGDNGKIRFVNILQFGVTLDSMYHKNNTAIKKKLNTLYVGAELRQLPVQKFSSILVFASSEEKDSVYSVTNGMAETNDQEAAVNNSYWNERTISFRLSDFDAQIVLSAFENKQSIMSFSYAFGTKFTDTLNEELNIRGTNAEISKEIENTLRNELRREDSSSLITMVRADAFPIKVDLKKWPDAIQSIDINEKMPAKFPVFRIYCFDFSGELRDDLYAKKIELKATSVNGSMVQSFYTFKKAEPDQSAKSLRFKYAVRFDKPFYYRILEITEDGEMEIGEWVEKKVWTENINITSPPEKVKRKPVVEIED